MWCDRHTLWSQFPGLIFQLFYILTVWPWTSYLTSLYLSFLTIKCKLKIVPTIYIGEGHGNPLQYSRLENSMDSGAWWATVHGVTKGRTWLTHTHTNHIKFLWGLRASLMAMDFADGSVKKSVWKDTGDVDSSIFAWKIPQTEEPG